jgi:hypothetical protein
MFIYFTDEDGFEYGIALKSVIEFKFSPAEGDAGPTLEIETEGKEVYEVGGKAARKAWDEIKQQIKELSKQQGWRPVLIEKKTEEEES